MSRSSHIPPSDAVGKQCKADWLGQASDTYGQSFSVVFGGAHVVFPIHITELLGKVVHFAVEMSDETEGNNDEDQLLGKGRYESGQNVQI